MPIGRDRAGSKNKLSLFIIVIPIYWLMRLCGLLPFSFEHSKYNKDITRVIVTTGDKFWFVVSVVRYCLLPCLCVAFPLNDHVMESSMFLYIASTFFLCVGLVNGVFAVCMNMIQREQIFRSLHGLNACDRELHALGEKVNYKKHAVFLVIVCSVFFVCGSTIIAITAYAYHEYHVLSRVVEVSIFYASYISKTSIFTGNMLIYTYKLLIVRDRIKMLNNIIRWCASVGWMFNRLNDSSIAHSHLGFIFWRTSKSKQLFWRNGRRQSSCGTWVKYTINSTMHWTQ